MLWGGESEPMPRELMFSSSAPHMLTWYEPEENTRGCLAPRPQLLPCGSVLPPWWPGAHRGVVEAGFVGEDHGLDPVAEVELHQDPLHVGSDGRFLDGEG